ncbi:MAG TPA: ATPase, partial [Ignisphaera sp.]|nr:ATPase [Ignisphaera sp.]
MSRARVVLIIGLLVHDSGKTWFSISLARYALEKGYRVAIYKPVAGHSAWFQYHTLARSRELGVLVGQDVSLYLEHLGISVNDIAIVNPIDILIAPISVEEYAKTGDFESYIADLENQMKQAVLA